MQMVDLPSGSDGLGWIVSHDPSKLLLIPNLHPASIVAAAAGDELALAYIRFTAQQHVAFPDACTFTPLDTVCCEACTPCKDRPFYVFHEDLQKRDPQIASIFIPRHTFTLSLLKNAAKEGQLAAIKWIHAICPRTEAMEEVDLVYYAASNGHLDVVKYAYLHPRLRQIYSEWDMQTTIPMDAAKHLDCIKWLLSEWVSLDLYDIELGLLKHVARHHGLGLLKWCSETCNFPDDFWDELPVDAAARADQPMLEWLRTLEPPVPWGPNVCEAAAKGGNISTLVWLRCQDPPCPWDATATAAAAANDIGMLQWLRAQHPPCPWDATATAAAAANDIGTLQWLRAQHPPCPWEPTTCEAAAQAGRLDILKWLRGQSPPCPWTESCAAAAACQPNLDVLQWLHGHGCPFGANSTLAACRQGNLPMLQWLHSQGCPLDPDCPFVARFHGSMPMPLPNVFEDQLIYDGDVCLPNLMFLADIGMALPAMEKKLVASARKAHCTFHGLVRWCRRAVSDPSRGAHRAFDSMAPNTSGQVLLSRLSMLPSELLNKIAVAAELQPDV